VPWDCSITTRSVVELAERGVDVTIALDYVLCELQVINLKYCLLMYMPCEVNDDSLVDFAEQLFIFEKLIDVITDCHEYLEETNVDFSRNTLFTETLKDVC
jgi:hypothetical protein